MTAVAFALGAICIALGSFIVGRSRRSQSETETEVAPPPANGVYVEVDCRECLKHNRVPVTRLRDRPRCGRCKKALAPGRRLHIVRVRELDAALSSDLDRVWTNPDHLWHRIADHLSAPRRTVN